MSVSGPRATAPPPAGVEAVCRGKSEAPRQVGIEPKTSARHQHANAKEGNFFLHEKLNR